MTQKHFNATAEILLNSYVAARAIDDQVVRGARFMAIDGIVDAFVKLFSDANPRFDARRFRTACGQ